MFLRRDSWYKVPAEFNLNIDESGYQSFLDAKEAKVVVPIDHDGVIYYGADKSV